MKRTNADPYLYFNKKYFRSVFRNKNSCCFIASFEKIPIAAIIVFINDLYIQGHLGGAKTEYLSLAPFSFLYQEIIKQNDEYIKANTTYLNAIKDLAIQKEYLIEKKEEFVDALSNVADKRSAVIKKALNVEKAKNKLIDGDKLNVLDQELNDVQRDFDRARDILIKKIHQFKEVRAEINALWLKLKDTIKEFS